jgi:hypothetical protein
VTLARGASLVTPIVERAGPFNNYTFENQTGEGRLVISSNSTVLFSGNFTLDKQTRRGMPSAFSQTPPDYVKYNQLINPDNAMTGYEQVLNPDKKASITAAEGATALSIFFLVFMFLGLLVFTKTEMV